MVTGNLRSSDPTMSNRIAISQQLDVLNDGKNWRQFGFRRWSRQRRSGGRMQQERREEAGAKHLAREAVIIGLIPKHLSTENQLKT
jgi:hypothetical protein